MVKAQINLHEVIEDINDSCQAAMAITEKAIEAQWSLNTFRRAIYILNKRLNEDNKAGSFVTLTPTISIRTGDIEADADMIISKVKSTLEKELESSNLGIYG